MSDSPASARDSRRILLASLAAAVSSFAIMTLAARGLDPEANRQFLVFWAMLFGVFGVLSGIQHETTRAVSAQRSTSHASGTSVLRSALWIGLATAVLLGATAGLWAPVRLPTATAASAATIAVAAVLYACHSAMAGAAAGSRRWGLYAALMAAEALGRLVVVGAVLLLAIAAAGGGRTPLVAAQAGTAGAAAIWILLVLALRSARETARTTVSLPPGRLLAHRGAAMFTAGCTAIMVTAFPAIIDASASGEDAVRVAALLFMLSLTRAPLMIPLQALQGVAIAAFVERRDAPLRALLPLIAKILALAGVLAIAAAALGPWALHVIAPVYASSPPTWAGLTLAGGAVAILTLTGTAALAVDRHLVYAAGWLVASVAAVLLLWLPWPLELRTVTALILGPMLGIALHLGALHRKAAP